MPKPTWPAPQRARAQQHWATPERPSSGTATELEIEPWTLLFDRGVSASEAGAKGWVVAGREFYHAELEVFSSPCVGPVAFTRATFDKVGGIDERYEGWAYEDVDFWYRAARRPTHQAADLPGYRADPAVAPAGPPRPQFREPERAVVLRDLVTSAHFRSSESPRPRPAHGQDAEGITP